MRVAIVHDYLNEYGGAERVLETLSKMYPDAPIYTAFIVPGSSAAKSFKGKKIIQSWFRWVPFYHKLYSPLRFLIPWIWGSFDFSGYDLVITSASWYITKGFGSALLRRGFEEQSVKRPIEICYCHTPPRWLYGYETSVNWRKWWLVRVYALIVGHFLRMYDYNQAQKVDIFIANSRNVQNRIRKFYRRESKVIYPPVKLPVISYQLSVNLKNNKTKDNDYYLMVTRIVGGKGIEMAMEAAKAAGFRLLIAGENAGYYNKILNPKFEDPNITFVGRVSDEEKYELMAGARAFLALSKDEDFGITPVEAQSVGTPVIAFNGGGYRETVINGKTGILFDDYSIEGLVGAINKFNNLKWDKKLLIENARRFGEEKFMADFYGLVKRISNLHAGR